MAERRADPVTFVLGGLSIAAGSIVLAGASLIDHARILLPVGLIAFGIALLVRVGGADGDRPPTPLPHSDDLDRPVSDDLDRPDAGHLDQADCGDLDRPDAGDFDQAASDGPPRDAAPG